MALLLLISINCKSGKLKQKLVWNELFIKIYRTLNMGCMRFAFIMVVFERLQVKQVVLLLHIAQLMAGFKLWFSAKGARRCPSYSYGTELGVFKLFFGFILSCDKI